MAGSGAKLKVGITFLIASAILLIGILWLKDYHPGGKMTQMRVLFDNSGGISTGDPVEVAGVRIGVVKDVSLTPENRALVRLSINQSAKLHPDAKFMVRDAGLMGDKALMINPGTASGALRPDVLHQGTASVGMDRIFTEAEDALLRLKNVAAKVDSGLDIARLTGEFEKTLMKIQQVAAVYQSLAMENRGSLRKTLDNVQTTSTDVRRFINTNDSNVSQVLESFRQTSERLSELAVSLQPLSVVADTLALSMRTGNNTFSQLVRSRELYDEMRRTNASIDSFLVDLKKNPGKYTKNMKFRINLF